MVAHSVGKVGVAPFSTIVPAFVVVCFALAIAARAPRLLYWLGDVAVPACILVWHRVGTAGGGGRQRGKQRCRS